MKIVLFGKTGQLGRKLKSALAPLGDVVSFARGSGDSDVDFADLNRLKRIVSSSRADVIVNAAAYTAVDAAEDHPDLAHLVNAEAPGILANEAAKSGALLIHYSTDYVFDGSGKSPWLETDAPSPLNVYGRSKLEGERAIQASQCRHIILRTSWVYSAHGSNFLKTILKRAAERQTLSIVDDQIGAPTGVDLLADATVRMLQAAVQDTNASGLYHVAASGETSWYDYAKFAIELAQENGAKLKVASIRPIRSDDFPVKAKRPLNSRLDTRKLSDRIGLSLPDWRLGVETAVLEILDRTVQETD